MSKGQSQPTTRFGKRVLGKCKNKFIAEIVEIIDVDNEKTDVCFVNKPESSRQGSRCFSCKSRKRCTADIVYIDDEEDIDDDGDDDGDYNDDDAFDNAFSSPESKSAQPMDEKLDCIKCFVMHQMDSKSPEKNRRHAEGSRSHYGFSRTSSDSSEYDSESYSDCEIVEDISGDFRKQWEKAATRRKAPVSNHLHNTKDHVNAPNSFTAPRFTPEEPVKGHGDVEYPMKENYQPCLKKMKEATNECKPRTVLNGNEFFGPLDDKDIFDDVFCVGKSKSYATNAPRCSGVDNETSGFNNEEELTTRRCSQHDNVSVDSHYDKNDASFSDIKLQEIFLHAKCASRSPSFSSCMGGIEAQTSFKKEGTYPKHTFEAWEQCSLFPDSVFSFRKMEKVTSEQLSGQSPFPDNSVTAHEVAAEEKACHSSEEKISDDQEADVVQTKVGKECFSGDKRVTMGISNCNSNEGVRSNGVNLSFNNIPKSISSPHSGLIGDAENRSREENLSQIHDSVIGDREKHKESKEYRCAEEEEWAARHRELQIQSEEAQRQRRRQKAENLRLLDMERRQKRRLEEIRQSQKKDEEIINVKEQLRAEITKELKMVEARYRDMASLLRFLGIDVKGGPVPLSHEINAAYKQALLKFHPDRASRTDIRDQVEAEEKFKLISRLKEKLLPVA